MQSRIRVNKSIETNFKKEMWKGLTVKEVGVLLLTLAFMIAIVLLCYFVFGLSPTVGVYLSVPIVAPILILGFRKFSGLNFLQYMQEIKYRKRSTPHLQRDTGFNPNFKKAAFTAQRELTYGEKLGYLFEFSEDDLKRVSKVKIKKPAEKKSNIKSKEKIKKSKTEKIKLDKKYSKIMLIVIVTFCILFLMIAAIFGYIALIHFGIL